MNWPDILPYALIIAMFVAMLLVTIGRFIVFGASLYRTLKIFALLAVAPHTVGMFLLQVKNMNERITTGSIAVVLCVAITIYFWKGLKRYPVM